jgi:hypothetical protein
LRASIPFPPRTPPVDLARRGASAAVARGFLTRWLGQRQRADFFAHASGAAVGVCCRGA